MEWFVRIHVTLFFTCLVWRGNSGQATCPNEAGQRCEAVNQENIVALYPGLNRLLNFSFSTQLRPDPSRVALFNSENEFEFCDADGSSYDLGSSCQYLSVVNNTQGNWTVIVECSNPVNASTGLINLILRMSDTNADDIVDLTCDSVVNISWTQTSCVVEEFHTLEDQCSGISTMATPPSGYIGTQFNVTVTNIAWVGRAVLVPTRLDFCGDITLGEAESDGINCTASLSSSLGSAEKDLVSVQCEGNGSHVPSGPAWIVFERNLTFSENCSDRSDDLSPLRLFFANYSGFKVQWRPDPVCACESLSAEVLQECVMNCTTCFQECHDTLDDILDNITSTDLDVVLAVLSGMGELSGGPVLGVVVEVLGDLVDELEATPSLVTMDTATALIGVFDDLLDQRKLVDWAELQQYDSGDSTEADDEASDGGVDPSVSSSEFLESLEDAGELLGDALLVPGGEQGFAYQGENIMILTVERVQPADIQAGNYTFPRTPVDGGLLTQITIPLELLCEDYTGPGSSDCRAVVSSVVVQNLPMILDQTINNSELASNSLLLSSRVADPPGDLQELVRQFPVQLLFAPVDNEFNNSNNTCVFWNFTLMNWSPIGIQSSVDETGSNTLCISNHLTSFAVLVDINGPQPDLSQAEKYALKLVSYIGCGVSLLSLLLALAILVSCGKSLNKGVLLYIHINFVLALALGLLTFLAGIETATAIPWLCTLVAALLHYFFLSVFCWMLAEGIMLYLLVVRVFGTAAEKWYYLLVLGWGLPLPVVGISLGIQHDQYGTPDFCWLSTASGTIWAFVGPMLLIIAINLVILVLTLVSMVKGQKYRGADQAVSGLQLAKTAIKGAIILLPLLGVTWVFGLLAVNRNTTIFAWTFTILNSLQGFFVFLFHVLRNDKVCDCIRRCLNRIVPKISIERRESMKEITSNMGTAETVDVLEGNPQDCERTTMTQYCLQTFDRTFSDTSQGSSTSDCTSPVTALSQPSCV